jgi:transposase
LTRAFKNIVGKSEMYYSKDLMEKVVKYFENHRAKETSEMFGVGVRTIFKWKKKLLPGQGAVEWQYLPRKRKT